MTLVEFSQITSFYICACLCWGINLQFAIWLIGRIMSRPNNNWPGLFCLVRWHLSCTANSAAVRITIQGSESSIYVSCRLKERIRFPNHWWVLSIITFACGFLEESGLVPIPYSCSIKLFLNSWPRNSPPRSYMISTGQVYCTSHVGLGLGLGEP